METNLSIIFIMRLLIKILFKDNDSSESFFITKIMLCMVFIAEKKEIRSIIKHNYLMCFKTH